MPAPAYHGPAVLLLVLAVVVLAIVGLALAALVLWSTDRDRRE